MICAMTASESNQYPDESISIKGARALLWRRARCRRPREVELILTGPTDAADAFAQLLKVYPELRRFGRSLLFAVNQEYARRIAQVKRRRRIGTLPASERRLRCKPVPQRHGDTEIRRNRECATRDRGRPARLSCRNPTNSQPTTHDFFELTTDPIDVGSVARRVVLPECGATVTLDGYAANGRAAAAPCIWSTKPTRRWPSAKCIDWAAGARAFRNRAHRHRASHRTTRDRRDQRGDRRQRSSSCARRFAACEWAIRELKRTVPIWKKEMFEDGEIWVEGEGAPEES